VAVTVGKYKLLRRIAVGGMAEIFLARVHGEAGFHRKVIIKKILPHYAGEPEFVRRLVDEGLLAARLSHGNIVQVLDLGRLGPDYFIAMEFVDGVDLRNVLSALYDGDTVVPVDIGLHILWQVSRALAYAHDKRSARGEPLNIVHRDISPANVFISWEGAVKLGDFGIAKASQRLSSHTLTGVLQGKFPYMSPEQAQGADLEQTSDIFSFGTVAYELLTQQRPFEGESDIMVMSRVKEATPRRIRELRPELPEAFAQVIETCHQRAAAQRFQNGTELERALARVIQENGWVVSESDVAAFLKELYGTTQAAGEADVALEEEAGEVLEASPLDPYDLRAGLPTPVRRATPPPVQEFTQAVSQADWRKRQRKAQRGWLVWLGLLAVLFALLVVDYTTTHLLLRPAPSPTNGESAGSLAVTPPEVGRPDVITQGDSRPSSVDAPVSAPPDIQIASSVLPDVVSGLPDAGMRPELVALDDTVAHPQDLVHRDLRVSDLAPARDAPVAPEVTVNAPARSATRLMVLPEDALVFVNDKLLGQAPQTLHLVSGARASRVRIEREGFVATEFELSHPGPRKLAKRLQPLATGRLVLRYNPASATVLIDGRSLSPSGGLNIIETELTAGPHTIIVRDGALETTETITIEKGKEWRGTIAVTP
jgi:hypothetical protein